MCLETEARRLFDAFSIIIYDWRGLSDCDHGLRFGSHYMKPEVVGSSLFGKVDKPNIVSNWFGGLFLN